MGPAGPTRASAGTRVGRFLARHRWWTLGVWLVLLLAAAAGTPFFQRSLGAPEYAVEGSDSSRADELIARHLATGEQDVIVFHSDGLTFDDPKFSAVVDAVIDDVRARPWARSVIPPASGGSSQISEDGHTVYALVGVPGNNTAVTDRTEALARRVADRTAHTPVDAYVTGATPVQTAMSSVENGSLRTAEVIGVPIALVILLLALGSVASALVPLVVAGLGVLVTNGLLNIARLITPFSTFSPEVASMVGLGVGIDYSMFIVSRFREERSRDGDVERAVGAALSTAGRTVAISGIVVMVSLGSLAFVRSHIFREVAVAAALAVLSAMAVALTLLPALLAVLGRHLAWGALPRRLQPPEVAGRRADRGFWARWVNVVMRRPLITALAVVAVLGAMASPILGMHLGINYGLDEIADTPAGQGLDRLTSSFSAGEVSPTQIVVTAPDGHLDDAAIAAVARLTRTVAADPAVASVTSVASIEQLGGPTDPPSAAMLRQVRDDPDTGVLLAPLWAGDGGATVLEVAPSVPVDSTAAAQLVERIRDDLIPRALEGTHLHTAIGGIGALNVDMTHEVSHRLPIVIGLVLILSFVYLMLVFRSLVLPAMAIVVNLLATGAAFGLVVVVFQHGVGQGTFDFVSPGYLQVYLPLIVFVLLFGLSMDYEVFLVTRIQEHWLATGDNTAAVAAGIEHTARPISAAAGIMVAVFGSFVVAPVMELKQFGFGLAVAVAIDATLVRLVLVPASMKMAGKWNWWLPAWLERRLPHLRLGS